MITVIEYLYYTKYVYERDLWLVQSGSVWDPFNLNYSNNYDHIRVSGAHITY
jgi:hypothetical protein